MIDIWLIFAQVIPFVEVLLHTWIGTLNMDEKGEVDSQKVKSLAHLPLAHLVYYNYYMWQNVVIVYIGFQPGSRSI